MVDANASNGYRVEEEYIHLDGWCPVLVIRPDASTGTNNQQLFPILNDHLGTLRKYLKNLLNGEISMRLKDKNKRILKLLMIVVFFVCFTVVMFLGRLVITGYSEERYMEGYEVLDTIGYSVSCVSPVLDFFCKNPMPQSSLYITSEYQFPIWMFWQNLSPIDKEKQAISKSLYCYTGKNKRVRIKEIKRNGAACSDEDAKSLNEQ